VAALWWVEAVVVARVMAVAVALAVVVAAMTLHYNLRN
jgi:hypothetical protein